MATASLYQQFLRAVWKQLKRNYPFVRRFDKAISVSIPKSASFFLGKSPLYDKYVILDFQHNSKSWGPGQFTINVRILSDLSKIDSLKHFQDYRQAEDGNYRLGGEYYGYDRWWCLKDRDRTFDEQMKGILKNFDPQHEDQKFFEGKWQPSSFADPETVIREALDDIFPMLDDALFARFGFPIRHLSRSDI
jgi:hypothetical protein